MRNAIAVLIVLVAVQATAGTITSINPSSIQTRSGEHFVTVNGKGFALGDKLIYDGNAGHFELEVSSIDAFGNVTGWIPLQVVNTPGTYSLVVRSGSIDSAPASLYIYKPGRLDLKLHVPELLLALARSRLGVPIKYEVSTTGGDPTTTSIACEPASGSTFPFGASSISCVAKDGLGGYDEGRISVTVWDGTVPTLKLPPSFEVKAELREGAYVYFETSAYDEVDGELRTKCAPESGSLFPNGRTIVKCEAADTSLNPVYGSFEVFVHPIDPGVLALKVPEDMRVAAESKYGANVTFEATAYGSADPDPVVTCTPESGAFFPMGYTKVYCIAEDDFGQRAEGRFVVEVVESLTYTMSDQSAEATSPEGAEVTWQPKVEEWPAEFTCSPAPGTTFELGQTTVECQSEDERGRRATATFAVTVHDTIAPHISGAEATVGSYDETRRTTRVSVSVDAIDSADLAPRCTVSTLTSDAAGEVDWKPTSDLDFELRATEPGAYRIRVTCADASGNRSTTTVPLAITGTARDRDKRQ